MVRSVLLKPLPVPEARRILIMGNQYPKAGTNISFQSGPADYYDRLRDVNVFSDQALFRTEGVTLDTGGRAGAHHRDEGYTVAVPSAAYVSRRRDAPSPKRKAK